MEFMDSTNCVSPNHTALMAFKMAKTLLPEVVALKSNRPSRARKPSSSQHKCFNFLAFSSRLSSSACSNSVAMPATNQQWSATAGLISRSANYVSMMFGMLLVTWMYVVWAA